MCAKFGSDLLRNVDLYKVQTNMQTNIFIYKIILYYVMLLFYIMLFLYFIMLYCYFYVLLYYVILLFLFYYIMLYCYFYVILLCFVKWTAQLSLYSDWLWAGWSGDRIPVGARFSAPVQTGPRAHPSSCTMGTGSSLGVKSGRGVTLTPHPFLVLWSCMSRAIPLLPPMGRTACTEPQCLYKGAL